MSATGSNKFYRFSTPLIAHGTQLFFVSIRGARPAPFAGTALNFVHRKIGKSNFNLWNYKTHPFAAARIRCCHSPRAGATNSIPLFSPPPMKSANLRVARITAKRHCLHKSTATGERARHCLVWARICVRLCLCERINAMAPTSRRLMPTNSEVFIGRQQDGRNSRLNIPNRKNSGINFQLIWRAQPFSDVLHPQRQRQQQWRRRRQT